MKWKASGELFLEDSWVSQILEHELDQSYF